MDSKKTNVLVFVILLYFLGGLNLLNPHPPIKSDVENRMLKNKPEFSWPALASGDYFKEMEDFFADHFVGREYFVQGSLAARDLRGIPFQNRADLVFHQGANAFVTQNSTEQEPPGEAGSMVGQILVVGDRAMELHKFNRECSREYARVINQFALQAGPQVQVYSLLAPTQIEYLDNQKYKSFSSPQRETIRFVNRCLRSSIIPVDAYHALRPAAAHEYLYFRTDHHWTARGAYYAYTAFMKTIHQVPVPLDQYSVEKVENFLGSLYDISRSNQLEEHPDTVFYYPPLIPHQYTVYYDVAVEMPTIDLSFAESGSKYSIFLSGDRPLGKITTEVQNGKKILVVKDSYGNALIPFLIPHYQEIYFVDPRLYKGNMLNLVQENGIQEVLFLNYVLVTSSSDYSQLIQGLL